MRQLCLALLASCSGGSATDAGLDSNKRCDPTSPFQTPVPVDGINSAGDDISARFSTDELTVTFARRTAAGSGAYHLYEAKRAARTMPFETPTLLATLNSISSEMWPTTSPNGLLIVLDSDRSTGIDHIYTSTRASKDDAFGPAKLAAAAMDNDTQPYLANARALYFTSATRAGAGMHDLWRTEIDSTGATATATALLGVNTSADEIAPTLSPDELTIYFRRTTGTEQDIFTATRTNATETFGVVTAVPGLSSPGIAEVPNWLSPDGCTLYVQITNGIGGSGGDDIFVARRGSP
jgi:hypothetical protein